MIPFVAHARAVFDSWCAISTGEEPDHVIDIMQVRLMRWQRRTFVGGCDDPHMALGVAEEIGELAGAESRGAITDAVGDAMIFAGHLAMSNRLALRPLIVEAERRQATMLPLTTEALGRETMAWVGRLAHVVIKRDAGAEGGEVHRERIGEAIAGVLAVAFGYASDRSIELGFGLPVAAAIYLDVGAYVMTRVR